MKWTNGLPFMILFVILDSQYICFGERVLIRSELCDDYCNIPNRTCVRYITPVVKCYNGQSRFPNDTSWSVYDIRDTVKSNRTTFVRKIYFSKDGSCRNQTDIFVLPFDECVGPFGKPRPWGTFHLICADDVHNMVF